MELLATMATIYSLALLNFALGVMGICYCLFVGVYFAGLFTN